MVKQEVLHLKKQEKLEEVAREHRKNQVQEECIYLCQQ